MGRFKAGFDAGREAYKTSQAGRYSWVIAAAIMLVALVARYLSLELYETLLLEVLLVVISSWFVFRKFNRG